MLDLAKGDEFRKIYVAVGVLYSQYYTDICTYFPIIGEGSGGMRLGIGEPCGDEDSNHAS